MTRVASPWRTFIDRHARLIRAISLGVALLALLGIIRALPTERLIEALKDWADVLGPWAPVGFVVLFIGLTLFFLPGVPLNILSGVIFGPWIGGLLTALGSNGSAALSFLIARYLGGDKAARIVEHYPRLAAAYHTLGDKDGWKVVAAVRLSHALPFGLQNLLLGLSPVGFAPYLLTTWLVTFPGIFMLAYLGYIGAIALVPAEGSEPLSTWQWAARAAGILVAAAAVLYLARLIQRAIKQRVGELRDTKKAEVKKRKDAAESTRPGIGVTLGFAVAAALLAAVAIWSYLAKDEVRQIFDG
jgi:uncharacterized membrane protein YdjX (TVP38/TMEM64 family)